MAQFELLKPSNPDDEHRKSGDAYKTISEVASELEVPQHVLRFWETHFPQVKPSRMRGSRRYYRPEDVDLLHKIKTLLYAQGYTIKGAKKFIRSGEASLPVAEPVAAPIAQPVQQKKSVKPDVKLLANELRVLRTMLAALV